MRLIFTILFLYVLSANGQTIRCNPFYTSPNQLFLDTYPSATVAYSLRKLNSGYNGNCIKVRRSSDNSEQDIGFSGNYLDTASMKTFVGNGNGFVTTWYDQSGSGNDLTQATQASQPSIITSGVVSRQSGIACVSFSGNRFMRTASTLFNSGDFTFISAIGSHASVNGDFFGIRNNQTGWIYASRTGPTYTFAMIGIGATSAAITIAQQTKHLSFIWKKTTSINNYLNSTNSATNTTGYNSSTSVFNLGRGGDNGALTISPNIYEIIGYASDQSGNRSAMQTNVNSFYSIY